METSIGIKCTNSSGTFKVENNISILETGNCSRYNATDVWTAPMFNASVKNVMLAIILTTIDVVTIFGNLLVLVAFAVERKLFQPFNMFIFNLAVTDFLVAVTAMTFYTIDTLLGYWPFGYVMCGLWIYFDFAMTFASVFTLVAISIDRFWCVTWAVHYRMYNNKTKTVIILVLIWFCVIAIWTPPFIGDRLKHNESHFCIWEPSDNREFVIFVAGVGHYIPCIIMVFCYIKVFTVMRRQVAIVGNIGTPRVGTTTTNTPVETSRSNVANGTNTSENRVNKNSKPGASLTTKRSNVNQFTSLHYIHAKSKPIEPLPFEGTSSSQNKVMDNSSRQFDGISNISQGTSLGKSELTGAHIGHTNSKRDSTNTIAGIHPSGYIVANSNPASNQRGNDSVGEGKAGGSTEKTNTVHFSRPQRERSQRDDTSNIPQHGSRRHLQSGTFSARERKIFITLTYVLSSYLICWFPFYIAFDTYAWNPAVVPADLYTFFFWMTYVNSTLNPFIYAYTSKEFRSAFIKVLSRMCNCFK